MLQEGPQETARVSVRIVGAGGCGATEPRGRKGLVQGGFCVIIQPEKLLRRSVPIEDIRLVPHFEIPFCHFLRAVPVPQVNGQAVDQVIPFAVILRGLAPAPQPVFADRTVFRSVGHPVFRFPGIRQVLRHESQLKEGNAVVPQPDVDDPVDGFKIVDGISVPILRIDVGGAPFVETVPDACAQQVVRPDIIRFFQAADFADQGCSARRMGIVAFIIADIVPVMLQPAGRTGSIHPDLNAAAH